MAGHGPAEAPAVIDRLDAAVNYLLAMDEEVLRELARYAGRLVAVDLVNTACTIYARITAEGVALSGRAGADPDVTIRGTPLALAGYLLDVKRAGAVGTTAIEITGDVGLAQDLQAVLRKLEPDFEEKLSGWIGDSPAQQAGYAARRFIGFIRDGRRKLEADVGEYLRFESETVMDGPDVEEFNLAVDRLRDDVERLKARIEALRRSGGRD